MLRHQEAERNGVTFIPRHYDKLQGPSQKHERKMLKVNRFRQMTVKELYGEHQMIGTYLVEERQFVKNMLQVSHAVPLVRLMMFGWRTDIDPIDFAGILNANALYSFTLGFGQLGFSCYFLGTLSPTCTEAAAGAAQAVLQVVTNASLANASAALSGNASVLLPPPPPPPPDLLAAVQCNSELKLGPLISIFVSIMSFFVSFCNICLDFAVGSLCPPSPAVLRASKPLPSFLIASRPLSRRGNAWCGCAAATAHARN